MIRNFITIALRNFRSQLIYSLINITGLAIGIACSMVILVYVLQERSYEKHFSSYENIFRIGTKFMTMGEFANGPQILLEVFPQEYPWVEQATRVMADEAKIKIGELTVEQQGLFVDQNFFSVFPYDFLTGGGTLAEDGIVISKTFAETLFGKKGAIGQTLQLTRDETERLYVVKGVIDTEKVNSHLNASFWAAQPVYKSIDPNWFSVDTYNYIKVKKDIDQQEVQRAVDKIIETKVFPQLGSTLSFEEWFSRDDSFRLIVQPLKDIYLKGKLSFDLTTGGNAMLVNILLIVALLIVVIAAINFINLSTARAVKRGKEVGIKKVVGSTQKQLVFQFLSESVLISLIALMLALGFAEIILLAVQQLTGLNVLPSIFTNPSHVLVALAIAILLGIISGMYPAFVLSSFKPSKVLKAGYSMGTKSIFRNVLVVFQFTLSTILIIGTIIIFRQLEFMSRKDLGFQHENILIIDNVQQLGDKRSGLKDKVVTLSGVTSSSMVTRLPGSTTSFSISNLKSDYIEESVRVNRFQGDYDYPSTLGFQLIQGRFFDKGVASDTAAVILNEMAVRELALANPIGEILSNKFKVIGVVRDFNFETLKNKVLPSMISISNVGYQLIVRMNGNGSQAQNIIKEIEAYWTSYSSGEPLKYHFLDDHFAALMANEATLGRVLSLFSVLAIFIACLGLFGLSAYLSTQRKKEIGIRKVMGASSSNVLGLFGTQYSKLILFSFLIAIPSALYIIRQWLSEFAYRVEIEWWIVLIACATVLFVAWATVSYHSIKASLVNPADTLRSE